MEYFSTEYLKEIQRWLLTGGVRVAMILIFGLLLTRVIRALSTKALHKFMAARHGHEEEKRAETLARIIRSLITFTALALIFTMVLDEFGVKIGPLLAAAGIVGVAVGFGSQQLVQDIISGFFILVEDQIRVGDVIKTADKSGVVEQVGLRMTVLRDLEGHVHYIRNGKIDIVSNMTKEHSFAVFDVGVAYREDTDEVVGIIEQTAAALENDAEFADSILEPIKIFGVDAFADSAVVIKCRFKTQPGDQWKVRREFNRRLKKAFDANNIEIPFPHRTFYFGDPKTSEPMPLPIRQVHEESGSNAQEVG